MINHHSLVGAANLVADGAAQLQLAAGFQTEIERVQDRTGRPGGFGYTRHGGETQPGGFGNDLQDGRHRADPTDRGHII